MKKLKKHFKGFTLVELIIVITILAILATITFISFKGYTLNARDGNRLATLNSLEKGLQLFQIKSGSYPEPDEKINIEASGTVISYQGNVGDNVSRNINMSKTPTDPLDNIKYVYSTNANKNKYQLLSYMEGTDYLSLVTQTYAEDLSTRNPKSIGNNVGIILNTDNTTPTTPTIDTHTGTTSYKVLFKGTDSITGSGNTLFSNIYNRRDDLMTNSTYASLDDSLVGYWDMESICKNGECGAGNDEKLKDLSSYENHGTCYNGTSSGACGVVGPQIVVGEGTTGKAMSFDGVDDYIRIENSNSLNPTNSITIITLYKHLGTPYGNLRYGCIVSKRNGNGYEITRHKDTNNSYFLFKSNNTSAYSVGKVENKVSLINFQMYTGTYDGNFLKYYIDGILKDYKNATGSILNNTVPLKIGVNTGDGYANGIIDEVRIYNRALSDEEIRELYNATK